MKSSALLGLALLASASANAVTVNFFDATQIAVSVDSGVTSDTISSNGYLFTYTQDTLFTGGTGGTGTIIGRTSAVTWPDGVAAQAVTEGPVIVKPQITLSRVDGAVFDILGFSSQLLANTWGTGGTIEVMPLLKGEDGLPDPVMFNASGSYGNTFIYSPAATALLHDYDSYKITLFVDFAITQITLVDASIAPVPAPGAAWLLGSGLIGLASTQRRGKRRV